MVFPPHQYSPELPHLCILLRHLSLPQLAYRRIPLPTRPLSTYPVVIGNSAIRPSIAPNRRRVRCPSASNYCEGRSNELDSH